MNDALMHYGVKGMKWGVRKKKIQSSTKKKTGLFSSKSDTTKKIAQSPSKPPQKRLSEMSDSELDAAIKRMRLEAEYARLSPKQISRGQRFVEKVLNDIVIPAATEVGKNEFKKAMESAIASYKSSGKKK